MKRVIAATMFAGLSGCAGAGPGAGAGAGADTLLIRGGTVYTLDDAKPRAEVVLVRGGRIACVGSAAECPDPGNARILDLKGGSAIPGLVDAHGHLVGFGLGLANVSLGGCASEDECVERLAARARELPPGHWVVGRGWDQTRWPGQRFPSARTLSRAVPDKPVIASRVDGHAAWVNAAALALAGISRETRDSDGGRIERDDHGEPTGVLVDNAVDLVTDKLPRPSRDEIAQAIVRASRALIEVGITGVHDPGVPADELEVYRDLAANGKLPIRVYAMLDGQAPIGVLRSQMEVWKRTPEIGNLTVRAVKMYADGALGSRGALLFEPYADDPRAAGLAVTPRDELRARILEVTRAGFQPAVHAIGDRACAETLESFVLASRERPDLRPRVEHLQVLRPQDAHLLSDAHAIASMQPTHATSDGPWVFARLGRDTPQAAGAYAWRQAIEHAPLACGSDFPVEDIDPRAGLYSAETRAFPGGPPGGITPEQKLTRREAIACFTRGAAYASFAESRRGAIKVGFDADITSFTRDVMAVDAGELPKLPIGYVVIGGNVARTP